MSGSVHPLELVNVALAVGLILAAQLRFKWAWWITLLLVLHLALVFLTNGVLFEPSYMPDQFRYLEAARSVRLSGPRLPERLLRSPIDAAALVFGLFPLPFIRSIYSISIINFILYLMVFTFLYTRGVLKGLSLWVMLVFPSLLLYTSVALRDAMVFLVMAFGIWLYARERPVLAVLVQLPLVILKPQNLGIFLFSLIVFLLVVIVVPKLGRRRVPLALAVIFVVALAAALPFAYRYGLRGINLYRHRFWLEEMGLPKLTPVDPATQIESVAALFRDTLISIPYFLLKPLPWQAGNAFQLIQSVENILVAALIAYLVARAVARRAQTPLMRFMLVYLVVSLAVYGLTVWNYGTAARYRFAFVTLFLVFYARGYDLSIEGIPGFAHPRRVQANAPRSAAAGGYPGGHPGAGDAGQSPGITDPGASEPPQRRTRLRLSIPRTLSRVRRWLSRSS